MDTAAEIAALRKELADLKQQMAELRSFITIEESEAAPDQKVMTLQCSGIILKNPDAPSQTQGGIWGGAEGPIISLWAEDGKARVIISAEKGESGITLFSDHVQPVVKLGMDEHKRAYVGVLDEGKPRAAMKVQEEGGAVTVVHDDGLCRAFLSSAQGKGELVIVNADMKVAVQASSEGYDGGGLLTVHHANGRPGIMLVTTSAIPAVFLKDSQGKFTATLPPTGLAGEK